MAGERTPAAVAEARARWHAALVSRLACMSPLVERSTADGGMRWQECFFCGVAKRDGEVTKHGALCLWRQADELTATEKG